MAIDDLMNDDSFIVSPAGEPVGPVRTSAQRNKIYIGSELQMLLAERLR